VSRVVAPASSGSSSSSSRGRQIASSKPPLSPPAWPLNPCTMPALNLTSCPYLCLQMRRDCE
jgi:hypothetical protein